jgi:hypothetical protein
MRLALLILSCTLSLCCQQSEMARAQIQSREPTLGTRLPAPRETAQQKRQKSVACNAEANQAKLTGKDRALYLKFCNAAEYYSDFQAPTVEDWKSSQR